MSRAIQRRLLGAALAVVALVTLAPLLWMLSISLMPAGDANVFPPRLWPRQVTLQHYVELFARLDVARYALNSAALSVSVTIISVFINGMAGYAFAKFHFTGRDSLYRTLLGALVVPAQVAMLPLFLLMKALGFVNSYVGVMIPGMASIFGIFLVRQYALSVPDDLLDAARMDGASEFRIFRSVVLPVIAPSSSRSASSRSWGPGTISCGP